MSKPYAVSNQDAEHIAELLADLYLSVSDHTDYFSELPQELRAVVPQACRKVAQKLVGKNYVGDFGVEPCYYWYGDESHREVYDYLTKNKGDEIHDVYWYHCNGADYWLDLAMQYAIPNILEDHEAVYPDARDLDPETVEWYDPRVMSEEDWGQCDYVEWCDLVAFDVTGYDVFTIIGMLDDVERLLEDLKEQYENTEMNSKHVIRLAFSIDLEHAIQKNKDVLVVAERFLDKEQQRMWENEN